MKYKLETKFISVDNEYRVINYEKSLSEDNDDHYEVCFDEEFGLTLWTKQSYLDNLEQID